MFLIVGHIEFNQYIQFSQALHQNGPNLLPIQLSLAASKSRNRQRFDAPFVIVCRQIVQSRLDVLFVADTARKRRKIGYTLDVGRFSCWKLGLVTFSLPTEAAMRS